MISQFVNKCILFIDDNYADQKIVEIILRRDGISVDNCIDPLGAFPKIIRNGYDAILVDFSMPGIKGTELIKMMQNKVYCPIYIVSAHEKDYVMNEVEKSGITVAGVISKTNLRKNLEAIEAEIYGPT